MKIVPRFWWDFIDDATYIIVQSDHPKYPILKKIKIPGLDATSQIAKAQSLIADLRAGRVTMKSLVVKENQGANQV
jgi:hypothetical protein